MILKQMFLDMTKASFEIAQRREENKNKFLHNLAKILLREKKNILAANKKDIIFAKRKNLSKAFIDRLKLDENGIEKMIQSLKNIEGLESPIGRILEKKRLANGLLLQKLSVPIGVILVIYESRPEVTIDVASLCIKSGNYAILKGGRDALNTNRALYHCILKALTVAGIAEETVTFIDTSDRSVINSLLKENQYIDLVIARGDYEMVKRIQNISKIPVLAHSSGGARIYVDKSADLKVAEELIINSKISKPAACNSLDTVIVHQGLAKMFVPKLVNKLEKLGVEVSSDYKTEFLDLVLSIKIVKNIGEALEFINRYTKKHTEGIIAEDPAVIHKFIKNVDAAALLINCSTRLHDGGVFGMGAEMGISTGKLHARGPVGLKELTTYKWVVKGNGQIRL